MGKVTTSALVGAFLALIVFAGSLALARQAAAECAWVMWDGQLPRVPGLDMSWTILGTYLALKECKDDLAVRVIVQKRRGDEVTESQSGTVLYKNGDTRGYLHCVPDTMDPRGPKAK